MRFLNKLDFRRMMIKDCCFKVSIHRKGVDFVQRICINEAKKLVIKQKSIQVQKIVFTNTKM
jgi:hypothetical protein